MNEPLVIMKHGYQYRDIFLDACVSLGIHANIVAEPASPYSLLSIVKSGMGTGILADTFPMQDPKLRNIVIEIDGKPLRVALALYWQEDHQLSPIEEQFIAVAKTHL
ncbi:MAG TPA: LysR family transcriptional regulator substrate-binding protein [Chloroflexota bacterium]